MIVATSLKIHNHGLELRQVYRVPGGYRLARTYPWTHTWPVRSTIEEALADDK